MNGQEETITRDALVDRVRALKEEGYRIITASCVEIDENDLELIYHFDKDLELVHLRVTAPKEEPMPSISSEYLAAFLVENEVQDQFGLRFEGLPIDYARTLYLEADIKTIPLTNKVKAIKLD